MSSAGGGAGAAPSLPGAALHAAAPVASPPAGAMTRLGAVPPPLLFMVSAISQYAGAALAVRAFSSMPAAGVAWLRVVTAAVVLCAWLTPWRARYTREDLAVLAWFGAVLAAMNLCFYLAIDRLPLGTTVAIEFVGPILVAAVGTRGLRNGAALALAIAGVASLSKVSAGGNPLGLVFALSAGGFWALYIVFAHQVARRDLGARGLAMGMAIGAVVIAPVAAPEAVPALGNGRVVAFCVGVGLLSSVIPYVLDQVVLRRMGRATYALLLSLLPATAALVGIAVLRQVPQPLEALGIAMVVAAVAVRRPDSATGGG